MSRTIGQVQGLLVEAGARAIVTTYDAVGNPIGLGFSVLTGPGAYLDDVEGVYSHIHAALQFGT